MPIPASSSAPSPHAARAVASPAPAHALPPVPHAGFDFVLIETVGVGQDEIDIAALADVTVVVLVPGMGDDVQAIKAGMMEIADIFIINKADRPGVEQTWREIEACFASPRAPPIFPTVALNGTGVPELATCVSNLDAEGPRPRCAPMRIGSSITSASPCDRSPNRCRSTRNRSGMTSLMARETIEHERCTSPCSPPDLHESSFSNHSPDSTIARFLEKRGPGLHHVAMRVDDLDAVLNRLESGGAYDCLARPSAAPEDTSMSSSIRQRRWRTMGDYSKSRCLDRS